MRAVLALAISGLLLALGACGDEPVVPVVPPPCPSSLQGGWDPRFVLPGVNGEDPEVFALAQLPDGRIVAAGLFDQVVGLPVQNIAAWDGARWSRLGDGLPGVVRSLAVDDAGQLWAVAQSDPEPYTHGDRYVARWDGAGWTTMLDGLGASTTILAVDGGVALYGSFSSIEGVEAHGLAVWNGAWAGRDLEPGTYIAALARTPDGFCAGGRFPAASTLGVTEVRCWNDARWEPLGAPLPGPPKVLARAPDGRWWVGGSFAEPLDLDHATLFTVASLGDHGTWIPVDPTVSVPGWSSPPLVESMAFIGPDVIVGGALTVMSDDEPTFGLARVGAAGLESVAGGVFWGRWVRALLVDGAMLHVAGRFAGIGTTHANHVATIEPGGAVRAWAEPSHALGRPGHVSSLASTSKGLFVSGALTAARATAPAAWFDGTWQLLPESWRYDPAYAGVVLPDGTVVISVENVVRWDGTSWNRLVDGGTSRSPLFVDGAGALYFARWVTDGAEVLRWKRGDLESLGVLPYFPIALTGHDDGLVAVLQPRGDSWTPILRWKDGRWDEIPGAPASAHAAVSTDTFGLVITGAGPAVAWDGAGWREVSQQPLSAVTACDGGMLAARSAPLSPGAPPGWSRSQLGFHDGASWSWFGDEVHGAFTALLPDANGIYVGAATGETSPLLRWNIGAPAN